jgi:hypothetical protein
MRGSTLENLKEPLLAKENREEEPTSLIPDTPTEQVDVRAVNIPPRRVGKCCTFLPLSSNKYLISHSVLTSAHVFNLIYNIWQQAEDYPASKGIIWLCYLTHWNLAVNATHYLIDFAALVRSRIKIIRTNVPFWPQTRDFIVDSATQNVIHAYPTLRHVGLTLSTLVGISYWPLGYDARKHGDPYENLLPHGIPAVLYIGDILLNDLPCKATRKTYLANIAITALYIAFNAIYILAEGKNEDEEPYIYKALSWKSAPGIALAISGGAILGISLVSKALSWITEKIQDLIYEQPSVQHHQAHSEYSSFEAPTGDLRSSPEALRHVGIFRAGSRNSKTPEHELVPSVFSSQPA